MKKAIFVALACVSLAGCGIFPKNVEFWQKKVKEFPEKSSKYSEAERQTAAKAAEKAREAEKIAAEDGSAAELPAKDAAELNEALIRSLGPPKDAWEGTVLELIRRLDRENAKLRAEVESFKDRNDEMAGKKVEGTGVFQVPYFLWVGIVVAAVFVLYTVLNVVLKVVAASNPPVALGLQAAQLGGKAMSKMFSEVLKGGEAFKEALLKAPENLTRDEVKELFRQNHLISQSPETQDVVRHLTR